MYMTLEEVEKGELLKFRVVLERSVGFGCHSAGRWRHLVSGQTDVSVGEKAGAPHGETKVRMLHDGLCAVNNTHTHSLC